MIIIEWERENNQEEVEIVKVPAKYEVCWDCDGEGTTLNENLRGAFTYEEFHDCFDDEESQEEYFKGGKGIYGVTCKTCHGRTTVLTPDTATPLGQEYAKYKNEIDREDAIDRRIQRMENGEF